MGRANPTFVYDEERDLFRFTDGKFAFSREHAAWALISLRELGAPDFIVQSVDRRLMPPPERLRGTVTYDLHGPKMAEQRKRTRESLEHGKPMVHEALRESGLSMKELRERAGDGKETVRRALYGRGAGERTAWAIAEVIGAGLSEVERHTLEDELPGAPRKNFEVS